MKLRSYCAPDNLFWNGLLVESKIYKKEDIRSLYSVPVLSERRHAGFLFLVLYVIAVVYNYSVKYAYCCDWYYLCVIVNHELLLFVVLINVEIEMSFVAHVFFGIIWV